MNLGAATRLEHRGPERFRHGRIRIAGEWRDGDQKTAVEDPATGEPIGWAPALGPADVDRAVAAAADAFPAWRAMLPNARGEILRRWAASMRACSEELAVLLTLEQGKPLAESRYEIGYGADFLDWFAAEGERTYGETIPSHKPDSLLSVRRQPIGVTAAVTPWNFPVAMITRKAGAALAAGCTMVVKPATETPLCALALAELAEDAGMPPNVFQMVTGAAEPLVARLLDHAAVRAVSFTGSTAIGRLIMRRSADTVKKVSLELGGHAPFIVFDDAALDFAVRGAMSAKFATSGQDCLAANRIYVQRATYKAFIERFGQMVSRLRVGHGLDPATEIGPMTRQAVAEKCRAHVQDALAKGASLVAGGPERIGRANFVRPTVLHDAREDMRIAQEETFGPVAAIFPFDSEEEVVARANATEMGLAAYLYTNDLRRTLRVSERLEYGMVAINTASSQARRYLSAAGNNPGWAAKDRAMESRNTPN